MFTLKILYAKQQMQVDFWIRPSNPGKPVEILVSPTSHELVDRFMEGRGGNKSEVIIDDLQKWVQNELF